MRILFSMRTPTNTRNFESTLRELADRGHDVHVAFERLKKRQPGQSSQIDGLCASTPRITQGMAPIPAKTDRAYSLAQSLRYGADYLRYREPRYRDAHKLRERAAERAPAWSKRIGGWPVVRTEGGIKAASRTIRFAERLVPQDDRFERYLREQAPDVVLVTPLVHVGPQGQVELLRAAKRLGIPSGLMVHSWDNLTNKGLLHEIPDAVAVWNDAQRREAVEMHRVPAANVVVTGAPTYDQWFGWRETSSRERFCEAVGLRSDRPFLLYLCSSYFIAPDEVGYVSRWIDRLRASEHESLRDAGVLIRPHPVAAAPWAEFDETRWPNVAVFPRAGADPVSEDAKADYFDSIHHSAAVVGVNTSALIESAIVGRTVHTVLVPEYRDTQEGTLHFRYLLRENGGPLNVTATFEEHEAALARQLAEPVGEDEACRAFVGSFIRPLGRDVSATDRLAGAIEALGAQRRAPAPAGSRAALRLRGAGTSLATSVIARRNRVGDRG